MRLWFLWRAYVLFGTAPARGQAYQERVNRFDWLSLFAPALDEKPNLAASVTSQSR
jgi:hypothetical protein